MPTPTQRVAALGPGLPPARLVGLAVLAMLVASLGGVDRMGRAHAGDAAAVGRGGRLDMEGGVLSGVLVPVPEAEGGTRSTFLWKSPRFAAPFEFLVGEVSGITYPADGLEAAPPGPCVLLRGGDAISATLESLDADAVVVATAGPAGPQRLRIARTEVTAIARSGSGAGSYVGPSGLSGWQQVPANSWREEAGRIGTDKAGAAVTRDVAAPARARYTLHLSGRRASEFRVAVAAAERPTDDGYVLQAIGGDEAGGLMIVRRAGGRAAIEPLPAAPWRGDVLRIVLFVDQERGRLAAVLPDLEGADGRKAFEVMLPSGDAAQASGRFRLELTGGQIRLDKLEVTPWRGDQPTLRDATATSLVSRAGVLDGFDVTSFDAARGEYVLARGGETKRVAAADVEEIRFPDGGGEVAAEPALQVRQADGSVLSGELVKVDERAVWLKRRGIGVPVAVRIDGIVTIRGQRRTPERDKPPGRVGTLVVGEDRVRGRLVGDATAVGGVAWMPQGSLTAAMLAADTLDAEVEYVARRPERKGNTVEVGGIGGLVNRDAEGFFIVAMMTADGAAARDGRIQAGDRILAVAPTAKSRFVETQDLDNETVTHLLRGRVGTAVRLKVTDGAGANPRDIELERLPISVAGGEILAQALQAHARLGGPDEREQAEGGEYPAVIVLRSGDIAPCRIEVIDAEVVLLRTPLAAAGDAAALRVPVALVKAVELVPSAASRALDKTLLDRLLTLPRMQRNRPPTHVLRLMNGDYLRGRLVRVDDATVTLEVLDAVKDLPRRQVARIIWLHPEVPRDGTDDAEPIPEEPEAEGLLVQGVSPEGRRITLVAEGVEDNLLRGRSRAFGESSIDLSRVDRLLIGDAIGRDGRELPFGKWQLKPAAEPRALAKPDGK